MTVDARIGTTLQGKYAISRVLGEGGMGIVYAARHVRLDRPVAIKFLHAPYARDRVALARFESEARAAGSLRHPNVVDVLDVDVDPATGAPFMVLEMLSGEPLSALLERRGALPAEEAVALLDPVLDALEAAHARGIVHRDLKPDNIFLAEEAGRMVPKLLDFGIAKLRDASPDAATATGTTMGTPTYMAPEQARGSVREIGPWTDVWAMGVVLFECTSGRMHFDFAPGAGVLGWLGQVATGTPRALRSVAPGVPETIASAIDAALEVTPARRTQSIADLRATLRGEKRAFIARTAYATPGDAMPATRALPTPGAKARPPALAWVIGGAAIGAVVFALLAWSLMRPTGSSTVDVATTAREPAPEPTVDATIAPTVAAPETVPVALDPVALEPIALEPMPAQRPARTERGPARVVAPPPVEIERAPAREDTERAARTRSGEWRVEDL